LKGKKHLKKYKIKINTGQRSYILVLCPVFSEV
jgi:hypothetical protein